MGDGDALNFGEVSDYTQLHREIISTAKKLRHLQGVCDNTWREPAEWAVKFSNMKGKPTKALTITLTPTGCEWAEHGGCTMCGEFEGSRKSNVISDEFHIAQFSTAVAKYVSEYKPAWLRIEQEGNYTNPNEMGLEAQTTILRLASSLKGIKRITIEARPKYLTNEVVTMLKRSVENSMVELEIGMGLEAENDVVRNVCVNKGESKQDFTRAVSLLNNNGIIPLAYILLKPPFLTEYEAIKEAISTIRYATAIGFKRISLEPMSIHKYTVVDALYNAGCYQVPWLWSVLEVAENCSDVPELGIGGVGYYPRPRYLSQNHHVQESPDCNKKIWKALRQYSRYRDFSVFNGLDCECKLNWADECKKPELPLKERIAQQLSQIDYDKYVDSLSQDEGIVAENSIIIAGGIQVNMSKNQTNQGIYEWADSQYNDNITYSTGFTQLLAKEPLYIDNKLQEELSNRLQLIHEFQDTCISIFRDALSSDNKILLNWLLNETPVSLGLEYHKHLKNSHYTKPVFFRTDEMALGKIVEIQCPGSLWGELQFTYDFYKQQGFSVPVNSPAELFSKQLEEYLGDKPKIQYLIDNASAPAGVRYFMQKTKPYVSYWGIDKDIKALSCNFVRTHSFFGLCADNYFRTRLLQAPESFKYDFPPYVLFDQKATLILPFWSKTRHLFSDSIRNLFVYSTPLISNIIVLEDGSDISIEDFSKLPQGQRNYYVKYAGTDVSINWGSRAVERLSNLGSGKCLEKLTQCIKDGVEGRIWLLQKEYATSQEITYWDRDEKIKTEELNAKYSCFYGPYGLIGIVPSYRKYFKVHGQPDTVISNIFCK